MESTQEEPEWLCRARAAWLKENLPSGLDAEWSPFWIKRFLRYLEVRNGGSLPERRPSHGIVVSFCRYIVKKRKLEAWKVEQARAAVAWLLSVGEAPGNDSDGSEIPRRPQAKEFRGAELASYDSVAKFLLSSASWPEQVRAGCRMKQHSLRTEKTYVQKTQQFLGWWTKQECGAIVVGSEVEAMAAAETAVVSYLDYIAVVGDVAVATQRQALNALVFAIRVGFGKEPGRLADYRHGRVVKPDPVVLTPREMERFLSCLDGDYRLVCELLYGSGLRWKGDQLRRRGWRGVVAGRFRA